MEKEFIPYVLALKLKELGFDEPCFATYLKSEFLGYPEVTLCLYSKENIELGHTKNSYRWISLPECCSAPTFSQAFRWFREKYGLLHDITLTTNVDDKLVGFYMLIHKMNDDLVVDEEDDDVEVEVMTTDKDEAELACLDKLIELTFKSE